MPSIPVYIKPVDFPKYQAIHARGRGAWAQFIHRALNTEELTMELMVESHETKAKEEGQELSQAPKFNVRRDEALKTCQHGFHPEFCRYAKPGEPCQ